MESPNNAIRIHSEPTFREYLHFIWAFAFRQVRFLVPFAVLSLICFLLAPLIPFQEQGTFNRYAACIPALILPGVILVFMPIRTYFAARKTWRSSLELRSPRTYVFGENFLDISAETFSSQMAWTLITSARKSGGLILLGTAQKQFYLVPMRDLESQEQLAKFRALVKSKVADCRL